MTVRLRRLLSLFCMPLMYVGAAGCGRTQTSRPVDRTPPPENAEAYFPLEPGWKWAYEVERDGKSVLATYAVVDKLVDSAIVQAGEERLVYAVLPEGIVRRSGMKLGPYVVKTPVRTGASWPVDGGEAKVVEVGKTVDGPAGTFVNCAVIEETRQAPARVLRTVYAAGVGPISIEYQVHDEPAGRFKLELRATLRGFTRPGEDPLAP